MNRQKSTMVPDCYSTSRLAFFGITVIHKILLSELVPIFVSSDDFCTCIVCLEYSFAANQIFVNSTADNCLATCLIFVKHLCSKFDVVVAADFVDNFSLFFVKLSLLLSMWLLLYTC